MAKKRRAAIRHRLFVVPLAWNDHGKSTLMRALLSHALRRTFHKPHPQKGTYTLSTAAAQKVKSFVFVRSFQETEKGTHGTASAALDANEPGWRERSLIIMPSHPVAADCQDMIHAAQSAGFDVVVVPVLMRRDEMRDDLVECVKLPWDVRWTLDNTERLQGWEAQVEALGRELWMAISKLMFPA